MSWKEFTKLALLLGLASGIATFSLTLSAPTHEQLMRFLKARNFDVDAAWDMLKFDIDERATWKLDGKSIKKVCPNQWDSVWTTLTDHIAFAPKHTHTPVCLFLCPLL